MRALLSSIAAFVFLVSCASPELERSPSAETEDAVKNSLRADAALRGAGAYAAYTYVFRGSKYRRMNSSTGVFDDGGSLPLFAFHLPEAYHSGVDAALAGAGSYSGKAYFFLGPNYARYDWATNEVDLQGTLAVNWGLPEPFASGVDAAVNGAGPYSGKAYFFKGGQYLRYDWATESVDPGYPLPLSAWNLPAAFSGGIDTAIPATNGTLAFIRGNTLVYYNWSNDAVTAPQPVLSAWPSLSALDAAPKRRIILYATIDPAPDKPGHEPSTSGLRRKLGSYFPTASSPPITIDQWWSPEVSSAMLADPHVLALWASGSFTEWYEMGPGYRPEWRAALEAWVGRMWWESNVPIFAVCGSHQLLSGVLVGWHSVGHMTTGVNIAHELEYGPHLPPDPRPSERGARTLLKEASSDPIFNGIPLWAEFSENHADEIRDGTYSSEAVRIMTRPAPSPPDDYSLVQALRYSPQHQPDRVVYTTGFHPEVDYSESARINGQRMIRNFVDLANQYWATH